MKKVSDTFREAIRGIREIDAKVSYVTQDGYNILLTETGDELITEDENSLTTETGEIVQEGEQIVGINILTETGLFRSICKSIQLEVKNKIDIGADIRVQIGIRSGDEFEYVDYGTFTNFEIPTFNPSTQTYTYVGYDRMSNAMMEARIYAINIGGMPNTINNATGTHRNILEGILQNVGEVDIENYEGEDLYLLLTYMYGEEVQMKAGDDTYTATLVTDEKLTWRDVLDDLCVILGGNLYVDVDGKVKLKKITETGEIINRRDIKKDNANLKETFGPVNNLYSVTKVGEKEIILNDEESITNDGETSLNLSDNKLINPNIPTETSENQKERIFSIVADNYKGIKYTLFDIDTTGILNLELLDRFTIENEGEIYDALLLNDNIKLRSGLVETCYADEL